MPLELTLPGIRLGSKLHGTCRSLGLTSGNSVSIKCMPRVTESGDQESGGSCTFCRNLIRFDSSRKIQRRRREAFCVLFFQGQDWLLVGPDEKIWSGRDELVRTMNGRITATDNGANTKSGLVLLTFENLKGVIM